MLAVAAHIVARPDNNVDVDDEPTDVPEMTRSGWFRWNPCNPRSCYAGVQHTGHLDELDGPGPGRWSGYSFDWPLRPVTYSH